MTRCIVIRNPVSRRSLSEERLQAALDHARVAGWHVEGVATAYKGHGTEIARYAAASGTDVIIVNGGDGTINEVVNGIARSNVALAVIPGGTANVWASEIHVHKDPSQAVLDIVYGVRRHVDLGCANGRYFLLMAGIGLDAAIVPRVGPRVKRWFGRIAYVTAGVIAALRTKPWIARVSIDGQTREMSLYWMLAGNTRSYGGLMDITHRAHVDDGLLDVAVMHRGGVFHLLFDGVLALFHRHDRSPNVDYQRARVVEVITPGLPVQVDGELMGETPMTFEIVPRALHVIVPRALDSPLFSAPPISRTGA
jgi:YegS/Rv2252/BmrU family lipid kinase